MALLKISLRACRIFLHSSQQAESCFYIKPINQIKSLGRDLRNDTAEL
jgi:hypothetical protein